MTLSLDDVERWQPTAIEQLGRTALEHGVAAGDAAATIEQLMTQMHWYSRAADAARGRAAQLTAALQSHTRDCDAVADAAGKAAESVRAAKRALEDVKEYAADHGLLIDMATGEVSFNREGLTQEQLRERLANKSELTDRIHRLMLTASDADKTLAAALSTDSPDPLADAWRAVGLDVPDSAAEQQVVDGQSAGKQSSDPGGWQDMILPPGATQAVADKRTGPNDPQSSTDPGATAETAADAVPQSSRPTIADTLAGRLTGEKSGDRPAAKSPLDVLAVASDPSIIDRQAARVHEAQQRLDATQERADAAAVEAYTGGHDTRDITGIAQELFDARQAFTHERDVLDSLGRARESLGGPPVSLPPFPEGVDKQSFPPEPPVLQKSAEAFAEGSKDLAKDVWNATMPDVPNLYRVATDWDGATTEEKQQAALDVAGAVPLPGAKILSEGVERAGDLFSFGARHGDDAADSIPAGAPHTSDPSSAGPSGTGVDASAPPSAPPTSFDSLPTALHDEILATEKGSRPDPSEYLPPAYIDKHLEQFDNGAARFMPEDNLNRYGIGQTDGTSFVMPKAEADALLAQTQGNPRAMEHALGLPEGYLDERVVVRVDIDNPRTHGLRMPSGNEAGANEYWVPGGRLPDGSSEAIVDGAKVPDTDLHVTPVDPN